MQHTPDSRPERELTLGGQRVRLKIDGVELEGPGPVKETTEAKPKPPQADDPRSTFNQNVGGPYAGS
jgi:hypothetical protein